MPLYQYQCLDCQTREPRLAGLDDHTALCTECAGMMPRLEEDAFAPYFQGGAGIFLAPSSSPVHLELSGQQQPKP